MHINHFLIVSASAFLSADKGGEAGGQGKPATIESRLAQATTDLSTAQASVLSLTKERDDAMSELGTLKAQFDALTIAANEHKSALDQVKGELATTKSKLGDTESTLGKATQNITRLESLCGVKGVNASAAVPAIADTAAAGHVYDQWATATDKATKDKLWNEHKDAIRTEAKNRGVLN